MNILTPLDDIRAEMEQELNWRIDEIRFLKNQIFNFNKTLEKEKFRKAMVVMLYSHFEGFLKTVLLIYIKSINDLNLFRKDVNENLQAASMHNIFKLYDDKDRKCKIFKRELPDDKNIHRNFRQVDLLIQLSEFLDESLKLEDTIIDTESNLKSHILRKNLFRIGINHEAFKEHEKNIDMLVNLRNSIAHGSERMGIKETDYEKLEKSVLEIMDGSILILIDQLKNEKYKK